METTTPTGFENIGNTCFANSVIQCLLQTPEMQSVLSSFKSSKLFWDSDSSSNNGGKQSATELRNKTEEDKGLNLSVSAFARPQRQCKPTSFGTQYPEYCWTFCGFQSITEEVKNSFNKALVPYGLKDLIKKALGEKTKFGLQQDAHEFLIMLLHGLQSSQCIQSSGNVQANDDFELDFAKKLVSLQFSDIFEGTFTSWVTCSECNYKTNLKQDFLDISLNIKTTFAESIKEFFSECKLEGSNQYHCSNCKKHTDAVKHTTLEKAPTNLIINLKKYDQFGAKVSSNMTKYDSEFNLYEYVNSPKKSAMKNGLVYELYAVINHEGKYSNWGHYTSYVKTQDGQWYLCDDAKIKAVNIAIQPTANAYILFYRLVEECRSRPVLERRSSSVSTEDVVSDTQSSKSSQKKKAGNKINRKRTRWTPEPKRQTKPAKLSQPEGRKRRDRKAAAKEGKTRQTTLWM